LFELRPKRDLKLTSRWASVPRNVDFELEIVDEEVQRQLERSRELSRVRVARYRQKLSDAVKDSVREQNNLSKKLVRQNLSPETKARKKRENAERMAITRKSKKKLLSEAETGTHVTLASKN
jgi:hypothetical protein